MASHELPDRRIHESAVCPAPPSSPPAFPPSSPLPTAPVLTRKRTRDEPYDESSGSSDPAIFSDDGLDRSREDYVDVRRKRKYRMGTWWKHEQPVPKAEIKRNVDSGVWLPSDSSTDSDTAQGNTAPRLTSPHRRRTVAADVAKEGSPIRTYHNLAARPLSFGKSEKVSAIPQDPVAYARLVVLGCLENGKESVDLSGIGLHELSDDALRPLHALIKYPHRDEDVPSSDDYQSFTPHVQLYLSVNNLRTVPQEVWRLENITVLSFRNNNLEHLSPAVAKLRNLIEFNISGNRLRWLPWELLRLLGRDGNLSKLTAAPNPFVQGIEWQDDTKALLSRRPGPSTPSHAQGDEMQRLEEEIAQYPGQEDLRWLHKLNKTIRARMLVTDASEDGGRYPWKRDPIYIGCSAISWVQSDGSIIQGSPPLPSSTTPDITLLHGFPTGDPNPTPFDAAENRVPSLTEAALRCLSNLPLTQITTIPALMPEDTPRSVAASLSVLVGLDDPTERVCSVCRKSYVLARAEWVEYWHYVPDSMYCSPDMLFLPFLRRVCSWGCAVEAHSQSDVP